MSEGLPYFICNVVNKITENKPYQVMYKYITDGLKYILKVDNCVVLKRDFSVK